MTDPTSALWPGNPGTFRRDRVRDRLGTEIGRIGKQAPYTVALAYPSPYAAAMSSLGFQRIYRAIMDEPELGCERVFLDDEADGTPLVQSRALSYESLKPLDAFPVVAVSVAYELEMAGLVALLEATQIPASRKAREDDAERYPFILAGGPLTFSNPLPLAAIVDAIVVGEAELVTLDALRVLREHQGNRPKQLAELAKIPHVFVPAHHGDVLPPVAKVPDEMLPAWAPIRTPNAVLADMFLIETERGCSRSCAYCVMRRSTNGGMRIVSMERLLELIPDDARKIGLVGAAVSDHPKIVQLVNRFADEGREVGLSSLRPDRLSDEFVGALAWRGPAQSEAENPSLVGGDLGGGSYELDQQLVFRPAPELCRHRTPLPGLYVSGASVHPGGSVQGMGGRSAARALLSDRRMRPWRS